MLASSFNFSPLWISLKTAVCSVVFVVFLGIVVARWRLKKKSSFYNIVDGLLMLPIVLPPTVIGLLLLVVLGRNSPIGAALETIGTRIVFSWPANVITATLISFPIMYQSAKAAFQQVDPHHIDVARLSGCSERMILWQILVPIAWPGIAAGAILSFIRALGEFGATLMLAGNIPEKTQTLPIAIFFAAESGETGYALTLSFVIIAISIGFILLFARLSPADR